MTGFSWFYLVSRQIPDSTVVFSTSFPFFQSIIIFDRLHPIVHVNSTIGNKVVPNGIFPVVSVIIYHSTSESRSCLQRH